MVNFLSQGTAVLSRPIRNGVFQGGVNANLQRQFTNFYFHALTYGDIIPMCQVS